MPLRFTLMKKVELLSHREPAFLFGCKPISVRRPFPVPGSLMGANRRHAVRTDEHRACRQQLLQVNQGNVFLFSISVLLYFISTSYSLFRQLGTVFS